MNNVMETAAQRPRGESMDETFRKLPSEMQTLLPEANKGYYEITNAMHCDLSKPGGSKFLDVANIFEVLKKDGERIAAMIKDRRDDRESLLATGVAPEAFLPATKGPAAPAGLPEALYYKVDGLRGKLGIIQLKDLSPETTVIVRREKSVKDEHGKEKVPCSFSVIKADLTDMPDSDFATVIIGREGGEQGRDSVWTIHPGAPIRATQGDFLPGSENLPGPQEGEKQRVLIVSVGDLLASGKMTGMDYVKIIPGEEQEVLNQYTI